MLIKRLESDSDDKFSQLFQVICRITKTLYYILPEKIFTKYQNANFYDQRHCWFKNKS